MRSFVEPPPGEVWECGAGHKLFVEVGSEPTGDDPQCPWCRVEELEQYGPRTTMLMVRYAARVGQLLRRHIPETRAVLYMHATGRQVYTVGAVGSLVGVSTGAATRYVEVMQANGWAERIVDSQDRRKRLVQLTDTGHALAERLMGRLNP